MCELFELEVKSKHIIYSKKLKKWYVPNISLIFFCPYCGSKINKNGCINIKKESDY